MSAIYYVKNAGDDLKDGLSPANAWRTLAKVAATTLNPSDSVLLNRGDSWYEVLNVNFAGTLAGGNISFDAYGNGARPIISAADPVLSFTFESTVAGGDRYVAAFASPLCNYMWIDYGANQRGQVNPNQTLSSNQGTKAGTTAVGQHFWETGTNLVYLVMPTGQVPNVGNQIYGSRRNNCIFANTTQNYITIRSICCRFTNSTATQIFNIQDLGSANKGWVIDDVVCEWGISGFKVSGGALSNNAPITIINSDFRFCRDHGCQPEFHVSSLFDNCVCHGNGRSGLGVIWKNSIFSNSTFTYNANKLALWPNPTVQAFDDAIDVDGSEATFEVGGGNLIVSCVAHHNVNYGMAVDTLSDNNTFLRCLSYTNDKGGFFFEGGDVSSTFGSKMYHCTAWNNFKSALLVFNGHGNFDARNNIFFANGTDGTQTGFFVQHEIKYSVAGVPTPWPIFSGTSGVDAVCTRTHLRWTPSAVSLPANNSPLLTAVGSIAAVQAAAGSWFYDAPSETLYVRKLDNTVISGSTGMWLTPAVADVMDYNCYSTSGLIGKYTYAGATGTSISGAAAIANFFISDGREQHGKQADPLFVSTV